MTPHRLFATVCLCALVTATANGGGITDARFQMVDPALDDPNKFESLAK